MKIIICGKGGCGKSTTAALLAKAYQREGRNVLVVDSDESNYGLYRQLGLDLPEDFTHYFGGKKGAYRVFDDKGYVFDERRKKDAPAVWGSPQRCSSIILRREKMMLL